METQSSGIEAVTLSDILKLSTWNRERTDDELRSFIDTHHAALPDDSELE
ncbi:MAG: hypothetical protein ABIQ04_03855 [Candidatus Saccharimonadales bacterium]